MVDRRITVKTFFKKYWKLLVSILICIAFSGLVLLVFTLTGATDVATLRAFFDGVGWWKYLLFILAQIACGVLLAFAPVTNMAFIIVGALMFGWWQNFILCSIAIIAISFLLYLLGYKFGNKLGNKLIGEDEMAKAENFLKVKGRVYLPVMFLFPLFPDDALCIVAGATKMKFWYFAVVTCICRPIGILTWCVMVHLFGEVLSVGDIVNSFINTLGMPAGIVIIVVICLVLLMTVYHVIRLVKWLANKVDKVFGAKNIPEANDTDIIT